MRMMMLKLVIFPSMAWALTFAAAEGAAHATQSSTIIDVLGKVPNAAALIVVCFLFLRHIEAERVARDEHYGSRHREYFEGVQRREERSAAAFEKTAACLRELTAEIRAGRRGGRREGD